MQGRTYIESYHCKTSTANSADEFWSALSHHKTGISQTDISHWPLHFKTFWSEQPNRPLACLMSHPKKSALDFLSTQMTELAKQSLNSPEKKWGIILSSTKGAIEEFVWDETFQRDLIDPLNVVLEKTIENLGRDFVLTQVVSNSCASSHGAFAVAKRWMDAGACDKVLVLAGDLIGPFIHTGFQSLKALSHSGGRPFQEDRDGLVLGEAVTAIVFTTEKQEFELAGISTFNESHTVTGPTPEGRGILKCIDALPAIAPDFVIAHGTATQLNDQTEDFVMDQSQKKFGRDFFITGTKWSVGHTLGASGSIDLIAALLCLKHGKVFPLSEKTHQGSFKARNYAFGPAPVGDFKTAMVTSLGFGGTNGALLVIKGEL